MKSARIMSKMQLSSLQLGSGCLIRCASWIRRLINFPTACSVPWVQYGAGYFMHSIPSLWRFQTRDSFRLCRRRWIGTSSSSPSWRSTLPPPVGQPRRVRAARCDWIRRSSPNCQTGRDLCRCDPDPCRKLNKRLLSLSLSHSLVMWCGLHFKCLVGGDVPVIHLVGAIKNDNILGQRLAHVLDGFRFASARGSARSAAHAQCESLGESYVASEREYGVKCIQRTRWLH